MTGPAGAVRPARPDEIEHLAAIWHEAWHDAHVAHVPTGLVEQRTQASFAKRLATMQADDTLRVAGDPALGFVVTKEDELYQLMVGREGRGTGAASSLGEAALQTIGKNGHRRAWLDCAVGNDRARRFYEREGWQVVGEETIELPTDAGAFPVAVWRMERTTD